MNSAIDDKIFFKPLTRSKNQIISHFTKNLNLSFGIFNNKN